MRAATRHLLIITALILISACGRLATNVDTGTANQVLHLGNGSEPSGLDPHLITDVGASRIVAELLEGLIGLDPKTLAAEPAAASSWKVSADLKTYTFYLNPNGMWSNGDKVVAQDFVYSWQRLLMPDLASEYSYQLFVVTGAEDYHTGIIEDFNSVGVKAINDLTLQVELQAPTPYFLTLLSHPSTFPVHRPTIEEFGDIDDPGSLWTRAGNYVGNGPFVLTEWALNRIIRIEKSPSYRDAEKIKLNEVRFYPIDNLSTEERMFRANTLHITESIPSEKIAVYQAKNSREIKISPYFGTYYYRINTLKPPMDDKRIRLALAMTIDRQKIVTAITKGGQIPAYNFTPPDAEGFTARAKIPFDIERAQQLLADAGYPDAEGLGPIEILYNTSEGHKKIAIAIQQMWKLALGIDVKLYNQDWKSSLITISNLDYQVARSAWIGDYPDPNTFLDTMTTGNGNNRTGFTNGEYDALIRKAANTMDQQQRFEYFQQAEQILTEEVPVIPIYTYTQNYLRSNDVKGWHDNVLDYHPLKYVYLARDE
ncbi:MAG: oligopeptide transport system substrate-binding protein [Chitinophagales bacterium]|jgi:oligopeptide transport system substrate-binding protein